MYQQINLYQPVFRQQQKIISAVALLQILGAVSVLLLGIYAQAQWQLGGIQRTAAALEQQYQQLETKLVTLEAAAPSPARTALEAEIARLQDTIRERQALLGRFDQFTVRSSPGFGHFFEALARHTLPGLWLTGVHLTQDGETELRGATLNPKLVPRYLQLLPDEPRFATLQQGSVHLSRSDAEGRQIEFVLQGAGRGGQR